MGVYLVSYSEDAGRQLRKIKKAGDKAVMSKIRRLIAELSEHPESGTGKPERLRYELSGLWSLRIDKKNRLIYEIDESEGMVYVVELLGHYGDR